MSELINRKEQRKLLMREITLTATKMLLDGVPTDLHQSLLLAEFPESDARMVKKCREKALENFAAADRQWDESKHGRRSLLYSRLEYAYGIAVNTGKTGDAIKALTELSKLLGLTGNTGSSLAVNVQNNLPPSVQAMSVQELQRIQSEGLQPLHIEFDNEPIAVQAEPPSKEE